MAAPDYVPSKRQIKVHSVPNSNRGSWTADRPGELDGRQPSATGLGSAGPDQGYAYTLAEHFDDRLYLSDLNKEDVISGCVALAIKRASLFGRAPVIHDLTASFSIYGFSKSSVDSELEALRMELFPEVSSHHHYVERRQIVDLVQTDFLKKKHQEIVEICSRDWSAAFNRDMLTG